MQNLRWLFLTSAFFSLAGCAGNPAAPFNTLKTANVTAYRLQNYEPPAQAALPAAGGVPNFGLPPEIQKWMQAGASMLPPNLLPPGLLPGLPGAPPMAPAADQTQRFNGFRILGQAGVADDKLRSEVADIFGFSSNFDNTYSSCMFAEFGLRIEQMGQAPSDLLVSLSCDRVQAVSFSWPHSQSGLKPDTVQRISKLMRQVWVGG